jgi:glucose-6-phosphate 1-epimerase
VQDSIDQLNRRFGIAGRIRCTSAADGFTRLQVVNDAASAEISLYGGQLLDYRHRGDADNRLFVSRRAFFERGRAIKGGVPICWPWFGADPENLGRGMHGLARTREWSVEGAEEHDREHTVIELGLKEDRQGLAVWPFRFGLTLRIHVGPSLGLALTTHNRDTQGFFITQALHTYFAVDDIDRVRIDGLDGIDYLDKTLDFAQLRQNGPISISREVDRIYQGVSSDITLADGSRRIRIAAEGATTAVVWNPWQTVARDMVDLDDGDYRRFVCIETANAADEVVHIEPDQRATLSASYSWLDSL